MFDFQLAEDREIPKAIVARLALVNWPRVNRNG
jgi:hypothetical protein